MNKFLQITAIVAVIVIGSALVIDHTVVINSAIEVKDAALALVGVAPEAAPVVEAAAQ